MQLARAFVLAAVLVVAGEMAKGDLSGTIVAGQMLANNNPPNFFDPANNGPGFGVPSTGYLNSSSNSNSATVTISTTAMEFGYQDNANTIRADFGSSTLLLNDIVNVSVVPITYKFTDAAFAGLSFSTSSDTFPGGLSASIAGSTVTIDVPAVNAVGDYDAVFTLAAPVPESGFAIVGAAPMLLGLRRRES